MLVETLENLGRWGIWQHLRHGGGGPLIESINLTSTNVFHMRDSLSSRKWTWKQSRPLRSNAILVDWWCESSAEVVRIFAIQWNFFPSLARMMMPSWMHSSRQTLTLYSYKTEQILLQKSDREDNPRLLGRMMHETVFGRTRHVVPSTRSYNQSSVSFVQQHHLIHKSLRKHTFTLTTRCSHRKVSKHSSHSPPLTCNEMFPKLAHPTI